VIQLHPPPGATLEEAAAGLEAALTLRPRAERLGERSYYDTFDGLLREAGLECVHESGELVLCERESGAVRARATLGRPRRPLLVPAVPDGPLHDALAEIIEVRALLALARLSVRERSFDVLDEERKTVVRLALSAPMLHAADKTKTELLLRLSVSGLRGYDEELAEVCRVLEEELFYTPAQDGLADEAVRAGGEQPGGVSSKPTVALTPGQPACAAVVAVLRAQLAVIEANLPGSLEDIDTEFLHDFRVAVRRSRAIQRECRDVFAPDGLAHFRGEFRWLQAVTGDARDMDVYLLGFEELRGMVTPALAADLEPLLGVLRGRHRSAHLAMRRALRSARAGEALEGWRSFLVALEAGEGGPAADAPITDVAGGRIRTVYRRMVRMGRAIDASSPAEDYHELRKKGKELRYLLELFGTPLYPAEVVKPLIKTLKALQDVLGRHQDREVQAATLRGLESEVARVQGGIPALVAMGALIQRLAEDEQVARSEFAHTFAPFAAKDQRTLVRETFR
jgi:CHAD domain-containing protein